MSSRFQQILPYLILFCAVFTVYGNVYHNSFLFDDEFLILKNQYLKSWGNVGALFTSSIMRGADVAGSFYRPLQAFLYLAIYQFAGPSLVFYHLLNVGFHCLNACLVYVLGRKLSCHKVAAFLAALLWAVHPIQTEAVTYISATADTLYAFFCLFGMIYLAPDFVPRKFVFVVPIFILALLSKETAIAFPFLATSGLFLVSQEKFNPKIYWRTWPLWAVAAIYCLMRVIFSHASGFGLYQYHDVYADSILCRVYTFLATLPAYLGVLLWPVGLHPERNFPIFKTPWHWQVLLGLGFILAAAIQIIVSRGRHGVMLSWGLLWFFAANILHTGILVPINSLFLEHWMYLPTAGLFLAMAEAIARHPSSQRKPVAISVASATFVAASLLGYLTWQQNKIWRDPETFYTSIINRGDYLPRVHNGLGAFYMHRGDYAKALAQYDLAIKQSNDTFADSHYNYGVALLHMSGDDAVAREAITHFKRALEINPDLFPADKALAMLYAQLGDDQQAVFYQQQGDDAYKRVTAAYRPREMP